MGTRRLQLSLPKPPLPQGEYFLSHIFSACLYRASAPTPSQLSEIAAVDGHLSFNPELHTLFWLFLSLVVMVLLILSDAAGCQC